MVKGQAEQCLIHIPDARAPSMIVQGPCLLGFGGRSGMLVLTQQMVPGLIYTLLCGVSKSSAVLGMSSSRKCPLWGSDQILCLSVMGEVGRVCAEKAVEIDLGKSRGSVIRQISNN